MDGDFKELKHWRTCPTCRIEEGSPLLNCMECNNHKRRPMDKMFVITPFDKHVPFCYAVCRTCLREFFSSSDDKLSTCQATADTRKIMQSFIDRIKGTG